MPDVLDNCVNVPNASQCDTDQDGYGNACDGDFNNNFLVSVTDFGNFFLPDFNAGTDSGVGTDMNCNGAVTVTDFGTFFLPQFNAGVPGPSGLNCAGFVPCP